MPIPPDRELFQSTPLSLAETDWRITENADMEISIHSAIASGDEVCAAGQRGI